MRWFSNGTLAPGWPVDAGGPRSTVGEMTALETKARAFAKAYPKRPPSRTTGNWNGLCGILMIQFGGYLGGAKTVDIANDARPFWKVNPGGDIATAADAAVASKPLTADHTKAPIGAFHFWSVRGIPAGHVGMDRQAPAILGGRRTTRTARSNCPERRRSVRRRPSVRCSRRLRFGAANIPTSMQTIPGSPRRSRPARSSHHWDS